MQNIKKNKANNNKVCIYSTLKPHSDQNNLEKNKIFSTAVIYRFKKIYNCSNNPPVYHTFLKTTFTTRLIH